MSFYMRWSGGRRTPSIMAGLLVMAVRTRSIRVVPLRWAATWSILSVIAGILVVGGDVPHLPRALGLVLFGAAGALAGSFASLTLLLLQRLTSGAGTATKWRTVPLAVVAGMLTLLILAPAIGVTWPVACVAGGVAGALSELLTWSGSATRLPTP